MATQASPLTREEELAIWLEEKKKKKEAQRKSSVSHQPPRRRSSSRPKSRTSTPSCRTLTPRTGHKSLPNNATDSVRSRAKSRTSTPCRTLTPGGQKSHVTGRPPRSSVNNKSLPPSSSDHLQRARNLLKERNYNQQQPRRGAAHQRKRAASHQPQQQLKTEAGSQSRLSSGASSIPLSISIVSSSHLPSLSPISISDLPTTSSPATTQPHLPDEGETQEKEVASQIDHSQDLQGTAPKQAFSFEEDEASTDIEVKRRRNTPLLLPKPSPFDPPTQASQDQSNTIKSERDEATYEPQLPSNDTVLLPIPSPFEESSDVQVRRRRPNDSSLLLPTPSPFDPPTQDGASLEQSNAREPESADVQSTLEAQLQPTPLLLPTPSPFDTSVQNATELDTFGATSSEVLEGCLPISHQRRRRASDAFLLLPTPSPFDPPTQGEASHAPSTISGAVKQEDEVDEEPQQLANDPGLESSSEHDSPTRDEVDLLESNSSLSEASDGDGVASHRDSSPSIKQGFSFEDDEDSPVDKPIRRRRTSFLLLPTPSPFDASTQQSIVSSPTSAFSKVMPSSSDSKSHEEPEIAVQIVTSSPETAEVIRGSPAQSSASSAKELRSPPGIEDCGSLDNFEEDEGDLLLAHATPIKVNEKTILQPVEEQPERNEEEMTLLQAKLRDMTLESRKFQTRLSAIQKAYDQRVTPFRDVFEEMRKLQAANQRIQGENEQLRKQKTDVDTMVAQLQSQMMSSLQAAVQNSAQLKKELASANAKIKRLEEET